MSIPKVIWQTHEWEYSDLPEIYLENSKKWQQENLDWVYRYHSSKDRRDFLLNNNFLQSKTAITRYDNMFKQQQADFWRVAVVYLNGGAYIDMDSIPKGQNMLDKAVVDADSLGTPYSIICTYDPNHLGVGCNNSHFIGKTKSEFLKNLLDKYYIGFHKEWDYELDIQIKRLEFIVNSINFGRTALYRDDVAFTFGELYHGDEYKPENWESLTI
jgi:hypothetical protein